MTPTEQKQTKKSDPAIEKPPIVQEKKETAPLASTPQQQQKPSSAKKEAKQQTPASSNTAASAAAVNAAQATPSAITATTPVTTATSQTIAEPPSPQPKAKPAGSWASLLKKPDNVKKPAAANGPSANGVVANGKPSATKPNKPASPTPTTVPKFTGVADIISKYEPTYTAPLLQPRGLINNVNTCFMNVVSCRIKRKREREELGETLTLFFFSHLDIATTLSLCSILQSHQNHQQSSSSCYQEQNSLAGLNVSN